MAINNKKVSTLFGVAILVVAVIIFTFIIAEEADNDPPEVTSSTISSDANNVNDEETDIKETAKLEAVGDYTGDGEATRSFEDGVFSHTVTADIGDPVEGKFYEGWIVKNGEFVSTGKLTKNNDGRYVLEFISDNDMSSYNNVVITEETEANGLDNKPEAHVLEGSFS